MFCVVYVMKVRPSQEDVFRKAWHQVTQDVMEHHGSLGARLHKSDCGAFIAYAQWSDREKWMSGHLYIEARTRQLHIESCLEELPATLLKLNVLDDLLQVASDGTGGNL